MQNRTVMDLAAWRAAEARGELWMFVDQHREKNAPDGLTEREQALHGVARIRAQSGIVMEVRVRDDATYELVKR